MTFTEYIFRLTSKVQYAYCDYEHVLMWWILVTLHAKFIFRHTGTYMQSSYDAFVVCWLASMCVVKNNKFLQVVRCWICTLRRIISQIHLCCCFFATSALLLLFCCGCCAVSLCYVTLMLLFTAVVLLLVIFCCFTVTAVYRCCFAAVALMSLC